MSLMMNRLGQSRSLIGPMMLLFLYTGCSRPTSGVSAEGASAANSFAGGAHDSGNETPQHVALLQKSVVKGDLPFGSTDVLQAGTLLTVRLKSALTAQSETSNLAFEAVVDDPVIVDGNTVVPRGSVVSGHVGSVRISNLRPDRGYVRLTLESLNLDGLDLPLKTANLFARQKSGEHRAGTIRLDKGHRLTFQLTEPFYPEAEHLSASQ